MTNNYFYISITMNKVISFFYQTLVSYNTTEIILIPSLQFNFYNGIINQQNPLYVISIKFLIWEVGMVINKNKPITTHKMDSNINEYYDGPNNEQPTSVPEKTIYDV